MRSRLGLAERQQQKSGSVLIVKIKNLQEPVQQLQSRISRIMVYQSKSNNFGSETAGLRENYLYPDNGQDYRYFLSQILGIFEASPAQIQR